MAWYNEAVFYHIYPLGLLGAPEYNDCSGSAGRLPEMNDWIGHMNIFHLYNVHLYINQFYYNMYHL